MDAIARADQPRWLRLTLRWRLTRFVRFLRPDTRYLPAAERSSDDDGLRMLALARRIKRYDFDLRRIPVEGSVRIQDVAFNALLIVANRMLSDLARDAGIVIDPSLSASFRAARQRFEELWSAPDAAYCSRATVTGELLSPPTIASFLALWADGEPQRMRTLIRELRGAHWSPVFPVPTVAVDAPVFDARRYWKGPTWINTNWLIIQGLHRQGVPDLAESLRERTLELVARKGFAEYFSPLDGEPLGAPDFSWTAALVLELDQREAPPDAGH
jgi:glycogen debranching enzyme